MTLRDQLLGRRVLVTGYNGAIANANEDVGDGSQIYGAATTGALPSTAVRLDISSGSANDALAGTGAQKVRVIGLDANFAPQIEEVSMNGQTAVITAYKYLRVLGVEVIQVGSGLGNAGIIYAADEACTQTAGVPSDLTKCYAWVAVGVNRSRHAIYTVPKGQRMALQSLSIANRAQICDYWVMWTPVVGTQMYTQGPLYTLAAGAQMLDSWRENPILTFPEKTDIRIWAKAATTGAIGCASMELVGVTTGQ